MAHLSLTGLQPAAGRRLLATRIFGLLQAHAAWLQGQRTLFIYLRTCLNLLLHL
jgi:hypothetical protein